MLEARDWTLDRYFPYEYDKTKVIEIGRLGVTNKGNEQKAIFVDMLTGLVQWSEKRGYNRCYGLTIHRFIRALKRYGVPFDVVSPMIRPYGDPARLLRFAMSDLHKYVCHKQSISFERIQLHANA